MATPVGTSFESHRMYARIPRISSLSYGRELAPVAALIEAADHKVFTPTARKGLDTPFSTGEMGIKVESGKCRPG